MDTILELLSFELPPEPTRSWVVIGLISAAAVVLAALVVWLMWLSIAGEDRERRLRDLEDRLRLDPMDVPGPMAAAALGVRAPMEVP